MPLGAKTKGVAYTKRRDVVDPERECRLCALETFLFDFRKRAGSKFARSRQAFSSFGHSFTVLMFMQPLRRPLLDLLWVMFSAIAGKLAQTKAPRIVRIFMDIISLRIRLGYASGLRLPGLSVKLG
jgi:hypothetical protein